MPPALTNEQCHALVKGIILQSSNPSQFYEFTDSEMDLILNEISDLWKFL